MSDRLSRWSINELASFVRTAPPPTGTTPSVSLFCTWTIRSTQVGWMDDPHKRVRLGSLEMWWPGATEPVAYGNTLSALLLTTDGRTNDTPEELCGAILKVRTPVEHPFASQVCSALMYTQSVTKLSIDWTVRDRDRRHDRTLLVQWITVALFSRKARHSIQEVALSSFVVDDADMDALEALLQASNPLAVLRGYAGRVDEPPQSLGQVSLAKVTYVALTRLPAARRVREIVTLGRECWADIVFEDPGNPEFFEAFVPGYGWCNVRRSDALSTCPERPGQVSLAKGTLVELTTPPPTTRWRGIVELRRDYWADVVVDDAGDPVFYEVLVPGFGSCNVRRVDAVSHHGGDQDEDVGHPEIHKVKSLILRCWRRDEELESDRLGYRVLCRFLHLVGAPLESLAMSAVKEFTWCLETVWAACPLLVRLEVEHAASDILRHITSRASAASTRYSCVMSSESMDPRT